MKICDYGCGQEAKYQFKNSKWCCSKYSSQCPEVRKKVSKTNKNHIVTIETRQKISKANRNREYSKESIENFRKGQLGKKLSKEHKENISMGIKKSKKHKVATSSKEFKERCRLTRTGFKVTKKTRKKLQVLNKYSLEDYKKKYPFLFQIEELKENKVTGEIKARCKNHLCPNSKEQGGWFTITYIQLYERIRNLDRDGSYFYCSQECKQQCPLYYLSSDSSTNKKKYTQQEIQTWRQKVLERENYICEYCGGEATITHHEKPVKTHPHLALDPDNGIACCQDCHYKYGHKTGTECSTGNLSKLICI